MMETLNLRYITFSDDPSSNYVILETNKYDIELNDEIFQVLKNISSMNDDEILHMYNGILNVLDALTIILLQADSSQMQLDYRNLETITFDSNNVNKDMVEGFEKIKIYLEMIFDRIKRSSDLYNNSFFKQYLKYDQPNEAIDKLIKISNIIVDSLKTHPVQVVSSCLRIITNNIIEDEKDRLMKDEIEEGSKRNENIIVIESSAKETTTAVLYVSKNNEMTLSKLKNKRKKYLINVKNNTCTCPDFRLRKWKQGLCCKHLMEIRNKSHCILLIDKVMASLSRNSYNTSYVPFKKMLDVVYDKAIDYNS
jgi:predicted nucleic acid-binding Zn finger protein